MRGRATDRHPLESARLCSVLHIGRHVDCPCLFSIEKGRSKIDMRPNSTVNYSQTSWELQSQVLRAIAHPTRLKILFALNEGPLCVNDLNALVSISQPLLSQHMAVLRKQGIIACHTDGSLRCYYVSKPTLVKNLTRLCTHCHSVVEKDCSTVIREAAGRRGTNRGGECD